jgi:hypothetical protein
MNKILILTVFLFSLLQSAGGGEGGTVLSGNGKFVFGQVSKHQSDQYMLNTETGQLWVLYVSKQGHMFLQPVIYDQSMLGLPYSLFPSEKDLKQ